MDVALTISSKFKLSESTHFLGCTTGMSRLPHGHKPIVRTTEVSIGIFIPDTICTTGNERKTQRCHGGRMGIDNDLRHGGATLPSESTGR
jgi:hypothetical protein